jgi:hypothetical protein
MTICIQDSPPTGNLLSDGTRRHANGKFDPEMYEMIIEMGKQGKSLAEMCVACEISKQTAHAWRAKDPIWDDSLNRALTAREAFLNAQGARNVEWVDNKGNPQFRAEVWKELKIDHKPIEKLEIKTEGISEAVQAVHDETQKYLDALHRDTI